jgi:hypothetical protein
MGRVIYRIPSGSPRRSVMTDGMAEELPGPRTSPRTLARIGGVLYLLIILGGAFGEAFIRGRLIVPDDARATAERILANEGLWRIGIASEILMLVCTITLALILYVLLRPVSRDLALLAIFFNLISIAVEATNELNLLLTLLPLKDAGLSGTFDPAQIDALSYLTAASYGYGFGVGLVFFGFECLILGVLIFRSGYLPRAIGVLMLVAGACYLINMFALILSPRLAAFLFPVGMLPVLLGEGALCLWLLVKGVDESQWRARANAV